MNVFIQPEIADNYDTYYQTEAGKKINEIEERLMYDALQKIPTGKMLELGCGTGHWTKFFVDKGFGVVATDVSEAMLKHALQKNLNAEIQKADSEDLPFKSESFDVVASVTMMEFVNNKKNVLDEIYRVLKPKGYLLLCCLNGISQLGLNAVNDPVFAIADFYTCKTLKGALSQFGDVKISSGVFFAADFSLKDGTEEQNDHEPAFLVAMVQKTK